MRKSAVLVGVIIFLASMALPGQTGEDGFNWSLSLANERGPVPLSTRGPVTLASGDRIRFTLTGGADCFVYIAVQDAEGAVAALHGGPLRGGEALTLGPLRITPPSGKETLFFVVSSGEQAALGRAVSALRAGPGSARAGQDLLNQIYSVRREISRLGENPERPLAMGGSLRGTEDNTGLSPEGLLFSGAHTYVKIITLEH